MRYTPTCLRMNVNHEMVLALSEKPIQCLCLDLTEGYITSVVPAPIVFRLRPVVVVPAGAKVSIQINVIRVASPGSMLFEAHDHAIGIETRNNVYTVVGTCCHRVRCVSKMCQMYPRKNKVNQ